MGQSFLLGLFHEATPTAEAIEQLKEHGVSEQTITVLSDVPYRPEILGVQPRYRRLGLTALIGAIGGLLTGIFLTVGTPILYPISSGGQPIIAIPPSLIIWFELTMLGTMLATFAGLIAETRYPTFGQDIYDVRITEGHIGILVQVDDAEIDAVQQILEANGAHHMQRQPAKYAPRPRTWARLGLILLALLIPTTIVLLLTYSVISIPIPDQMVEQASIAYGMGPRLAAPAEAVPMQGPELINGQPASDPLPASQASIARGAELYSINCAMCHGDSGQGDGPLNEHFSPRPADLSSADVAALTDDQIFITITQGRGPMPSLAENLLPNDRWDVINYVRSLEK